MGESPQQLVAAIMVDDRLADDRAQPGHALPEPGGHSAAVQRKVGSAGSLGQGGLPGTRGELIAASDRIRRYAPATIQANVLDRVDLGDAHFDSIGANFLFHCLPGGLEAKAATVASNLRPYLASGGVLFGSTILGRGVSHNLVGRRLMRLYNRKRVFSNLEDDQRGLEQGLASELTDVQIEVVGAVALFAGRA